MMYVSASPPCSHKLNIPSYTRANFCVSLYIMTIGIWPFPFRFIYSGLLGWHAVWWAGTYNFKVERETNKIKLIWCLLSIVYLNMFWASLCPSSGEQDCVLLHMVFSTSAGCRRVELGRRLCALCESCLTFTQCTQSVSQLQMTTASTISAEHHIQ